MLATRQLSVLRQPLQNTWNSSRDPPMTNKQIHTGLKTYRLGDDGPSSAREKAFAEQWQQEQNHDLLAYL